MNDIGVPITKIDGAEKISGRARYVDDIQIPGALYARTVRSTIAKGDIVAITLPELPAGCFVVDHHDIPGPNFVKIIAEDMPIFAETSVRYVGEPILLVVGPDAKTVIDVTRKIRITYDEQSPTFAWVDSGVRHSYRKGDPKTAFQQAARTIAHIYRTGYQEQAYIEPQGMLGYPEADGKVTLVGSIQCPYYVKNAVLSALGCPEDKVRVIQAEVGGAFGGKEEFPSLIACQVAVAVRKTGQPVKLIYERGEDVETTTKRHPSQIVLTAAIDADLKIVGLKATVGLDAGAHLGLSGVVLSRALIAATGAYTIPNVEVEGDAFRTNTVPTGAFRGFGAPQMFFAIEMFFQHIAKDLGIDPLAFKRRHLAKQGDLTSTGGMFRDPILVETMIERVLEASDFRRKQREFKKSDRLRGMGISLFFHGCGFTGSGESTHIKGRVKLAKSAEGDVTILIAAVDMGQGVRTAMIKIVASVLGLPIGRIRFPAPDTDAVPDSGPTVASRTTMIVGGLCARAAKRLKDEWMEGRDQTVEERYVQPDFIEWDEEHFQGDAYPAYSWGVVAVEVEIDRSTGQVTQNGIWSGYDMGKAIDERLALGQADGGIAQGIAYGYLEKMEITGGKVRQKNLTDYLIPTTADVCETTTFFVDNPFPFGPYGAKGAGELTLIGGAPAIASAIENAIGRRVYGIPATPEMILELIEHGEN